MMVILGNKCKITIIVFKSLTVVPCTSGGVNLRQRRTLYSGGIDKPAIIVNLPRAPERGVARHSIDRCIIGFQKFLSYFQAVTLTTILANLFVHCYGDCVLCEYAVPCMMPATCMHMIYNTTHANM